MKDNQKTIKWVFAGFFLSGLFSLSIGALMPDFILNLNLNYTQAGSILSMFAIGDLFGNFTYPFIASKVGRKKAIALTTLGAPLAYLLIVILKSKMSAFVPLLFLLMGYARGSVNVNSNGIINDISDNKTKAMNYLHTIWALGAFVAAFAIVVLKKVQINFDGLMIYMAIMTLLMALCYQKVDYNYEVHQEANHAQKVSRKPDLFFYSIAFVLFFYIGLENTINGWLLTYFQNTGRISESLSSYIISLTWLMIMFGRTFTALISDRVEGIKIVFVYTAGIALMILFLLNTNAQSIIFIIMLCLGFFLSAIYPTSVSNAQDYVLDNQKQMSILLISASLGGILTPQIIGFVADKTSIVFAMNIILINAFAMLVFATVSLVKRKKAKA